MDLTGTTIASISIHAPAWGATLDLKQAIDIYLFQSTLPRGERLCALLFTVAFVKYFNPRSRVGSDSKNA